MFNWYFYTVHNSKNDSYRFFLWGLSLIGRYRYNVSFKTFSARGIEAVYQEAKKSGFRISKSHVRSLLLSGSRHYKIPKFGASIFKAFTDLLGEVIDKNHGLDNSIESLTRLYNRILSADRRAPLPKVNYWKYLCISNLEGKLSQIAETTNMSRRNEAIFEQLVAGFRKNTSGIVDGKLILSKR